MYHVCDLYLNSWCTLHFTLYSELLIFTGVVRDFWISFILQDSKCIVQCTKYNVEHCIQLYLVVWISILKTQDSRLKTQERRGSKRRVNYLADKSVFLCPVLCSVLTSSQKPYWELCNVPIFFFANLPSPHFVRRILNWK